MKITAPHSKSPARASGKSPAFDAVIFDIDNVLIDTRGSYLEAIRWTVEMYLTHGRVPHFVPGQKGSGPELLKLEDVERFKHLGGFNDDWDCCYGLLVYLLSLPVKARSLKALRSAMNLGALEKKFRTRPVGVNGIVSAYGPVRHVTIERIGRIFQEIYLGSELFKKTMDVRPAYWKRSGLIRRERLIFKLPLLEKLRNLGIPMGIATGRPRFEALYTLDQFRLRDYFKAITTMDEVKAAERDRKCSLRKPHPFSLLETARQLGKGGRFVYVGDLPDDILASKSAAREIKISAAAFPAMSSNPAAAMRSFREAGADFILQKPSDLLKLVQTGKI